MPVCSSNTNIQVQQLTVLTLTGYIVLSSVSQIGTMPNDIVQYESIAFWV